VCPQISAPRTPIQAKKPNVFNATRPPDRPKYAHSPQTRVWPAPADGVVAITAAQLGYLLEGIDWRNPQRTWRPLAAG
jgi:transposase